MVEFRHFNLTELNFGALMPGGEPIDVIFCRNVLIYFSLAVIQRVIRNFWDVLRDGGIYIPGASDNVFYFSERFEALQFPDAIVYRKDARNPGKRRTRPDPDAGPAVRAPAKPRLAPALPADVYAQQLAGRNLAAPTPPPVEPPPETETSLTGSAE